MTISNSRRPLAASYLCALGLTLAVGSPVAHAQWLVTPEEAQASQAAPQALAPRTWSIVAGGLV